MIDKITKWIKLYQNGYELHNIKVVLTSDLYNTLLSESESANTLTETPPNILGVPIEINDNIATEFYITEILNE